MVADRGKREAMVCATDSDDGEEAVMSGAYWLLGNLAIVRVGGEETDGRFSLVEFLSPADDMIPLHVHRRDSQTVYVLDGEVPFYLPGDSRVLNAGEFIPQPAGV